MSDAELLQEFADSQSEAAFRELVERHLPMVHSAALRQVGDPALAQDVAQIVFIILARKAERLSSGTILTGWLFRTTRYTAAKVMRQEQRRRRREQEAFDMSGGKADHTWERMAPWLDEAMAELGEVERNAILLHYFQNKRLREVALLLKLSEDAAGKRVSRGIEKLRKWLTKRRVAVSAAVIPGLLMTHAAQAAPPSVGLVVAAGALGRAPLSSTVVAVAKAALKESVLPKVGLAVAGVACVAAAIALLAHFWPAGNAPDSSGYTLDGGIVPRHLRPALAKANLPPPAKPAPGLAPATSSTASQVSRNPVALVVPTNAPAQVPLLRTSAPSRELAVPQNAPPGRPAQYAARPPVALQPPVVVLDAVHNVPGIVQTDWNLGTNRALFERQLREAILEQQMMYYRNSPWRPLQRGTVPPGPQSNYRVPVKRLQ